MHCFRSGSALPALVFALALAPALLLAVPGSAAAAHCVADLDGSGAVDGWDLALLLGCWGKVEDRGCARADFDGDGEVGCFDQEYLLGNWGACGCPGDVDGDGDVDGADLAIALGTFGNDCRFDLDQNGTVESQDVDALLCLWGTAGPLGDFDGNGVIDGSDLALLLSAIPRDCRADLDHDSDIDGDDIDLLLLNWGSCP
jgi:hypothetical protein